VHDRTANPPLSYVLAAMTTEEVSTAVSWLWRRPISTPAEIILAAPATVLGAVAARTIPPGVTLASALNPPDRKAVRVAGARATKGLLVVVIDCDEDIGSKVWDPLTNPSPSPNYEDPSTWPAQSEAGDPRAGESPQVHWINPANREST